MLLEPGPLSPLDPDRVLPPRLTFGFEAIAANTSQQIENARAAIASAQSQMAGDLGGGAGGALDTLLARAATAHAGQVGAGPFTLATHLDTAGHLSDELAFVASHFPAENERPPLPPVNATPDNVFEYIVLPPAPAPGAPPPAPPPSSGGGGGSGGGDGGGSTGGRDARELLELYMALNPSERPRIERFVADNNGDWHRAPSALNLPGWSEFVSRHG